MPSRRRFLPFLLLALLCGACLAAPAAVAGDNYQQTQKRLEQLRSRMQAVQSALADRRKDEDRLSRDLAGLEKRIGTVTARLRDLAGQRARKNDRIAKLREQYRLQRQRVVGDKEVLRQQIVGAYLAGGQEYLKLLLNQQDPAELDRVLVYYDYLNRQRSSQIRAAVEELQRLDDLQQALNTQLKSLADLEAEQKQRRAELEQTRADRSKLLAKIKAEIQTKGQTLARMHGDERRLEKLVEQLRDALADIPEQTVERKPFRTLKGSLPWPVRGRVAERYGAPRAGGDTRWSGLLIRAPAGTEVHAISHGRVVFADWLRGLGLLIIIDHGNGYMSLYGHNQSLFKEVGDWVEAGEVIATVGSTGGGEKSALYFEVRAKGKPQNPEAWLASR